MSRRKNRIHSDALGPSAQDDIALSDAVEERFLTLSGTYLRVKHEELPIPADMNYDMLRWRKMRVRHKRGDFRHSAAELKSVQVIAQWTLDVNRELRNQPAEPPHQWR